MFEVAVLASGSKGNCCLVRTEHTKILFDAGLSARRTANALEHLHLQTNKLDALIISHDHSDHAANIGVLCRKFNIPVFATSDTYDQILAHRKNYIMSGTMSEQTALPQGSILFEAGGSFRIGDIHVQPFAAPHDATDSCNFIFSQQDNLAQKLGIITDRGYVCNMLINKLASVTTLVLESNHDKDMLFNGPYPPALKWRIHGRHGHLSNSDAVDVIRQIMHPDFKNLILAHLSEENNTPQLAYQNMKKFLDSNKLNLKLIIAQQTVPTPLISI